MKQFYKIVYCVPSLYIPGGVERVLTLKANYFAEHLGYDITIVLTDGKDKPLAFSLSDKVKVVNLDINFDELWECSFFKKAFLYLVKQQCYKRRLRNALMSIRPDITDSLLRREINFINSINDGSKKIGELHVNRSNYRNFEANETNLLKNLFAKYWMYDLISHLRQLDRFVVLTEEDRQAWTELDNVVAIPNPVSFPATEVSDLSRQRVIAVGRYAYQKGFDMLLKAWKIVEQGSQGWTLAVFGSGDREPYERMMEELAIDRSRCHLYGNTSEIQKEYLGSSIFAVSSRFEGLSMAMLEAMSCGLPVVSFACPCGPRDVITDGENGILVPKEDYEQLACGLLRLIQLPDLLRGMGKNAKERAADFKIEMLAGKWVQLFNSL